MEIVAPAKESTSNFNKFAYTDSVGGGFHFIMKADFNKLSDMKYGRLFLENAVDKLWTQVQYEMEDK